MYLKQVPQPVVGHRRADVAPLNYWPFLIASTVSYIVLGPRLQPYGRSVDWMLSIASGLATVEIVVAIFGTLRSRELISRSFRPDHDIPYDSLLVVVLPTVGRRDVYPTLKRAVDSFLQHLPPYFPALRVDIVIEETAESRAEIGMLAATDEHLRLLVIPQSYQTPRGTRFKARALHYAHELRRKEKDDGCDVWVLHMDDDTAVGPDTGESLLRFVQEQRRSRRPKVVAQGILTFPREYSLHFICWMADAYRATDDVSMFAAMTGSGTPLNGMHGELMLVNAAVEATVGWDFGRHCIAEDSHAALLFSTHYPGRSGWFSGRCYGTSPLSLADFFRQRQRWSIGLNELVTMSSIPWRYRVWILFRNITNVVAWCVNVISLVLWVGTGNISSIPMGPLPFILWCVGFGYKVWRYWEGLKLNIGASYGRSKPTWLECVPLVALMPLLEFLETTSAVAGLASRLYKKPDSFHVIKKSA
jgi:beta-1,4-mannosyltransferase